jgi:hypothetical protein
LKDSGKNSGVSLLYLRYSSPKKFSSSLYSFLQATAAKQLPFLVQYQKKIVFSSVGRSDIENIIYILDSQVLKFLN